MISKKMQPYLHSGSVIRSMFEAGSLLAAEIGEENVFDFTLGNPNAPAPDKIRQAMKSILDEKSPQYVHGYMSNAGYPEVREKIAADLNSRFGTAFSAGNLIMTVGAGSALNVCLKTVLDPGDEVVVFAPYFLEYSNYVGNYDGVLVEVEPLLPTFGLNIPALASRLTPKTKAVILNNPNNPTGVVYSEENIRELCNILKAKEEEYGHAIYLISDEPYRELAYDGVKVPFVTNYYDDVMVVYSYSKSLSLPGERIGYVLIPDTMEDKENVFTAAVTANRIIGCVNAPSLIQLAVAECADERVDLEFYDRNRRTLYEGLTKLGYDCLKPEGAFYLWMRCPMQDEQTFLQRALQQHILMVPGSAFAWPGYMRIAYCTSYDKIERSLGAFEKLREQCRPDDGPDHGSEESSTSLRIAE